MMKMALISDIHANMEALGAVLRDIGRKGITDIRCLGDYVDYGAEPNETIATARKYPGLLGNHDSYQLHGLPSGRLWGEGVEESHDWTTHHLSPESRSFLRELDKKGSREGINLNGHRLLLVHGSPDNPLNGYTFIPPGYPRYTLTARLEYQLDSEASDARAFFCGHSHLPGKRQLDKGRFVVNVGSVGQPRDENPQSCYCVTDGTFDGTSLIRLDYDFKETQRKIRDAGLPERNALRLERGR